ncbi:MAG TPA: hypothetical protein VJU81_16950 [Methylomirabilota bacterium]|nr:hypothetical protein [Methylomirabilota bacterium]
MPNSDALGMFIVAALLAIGVAADAQTGTAPGMKAEAKPGAVVVEAVTFKAKVDAVDKDKRLLTLTGPRGNTATIKAGPEVKNFDQIKVGDTLTVRYLDSVALFVRKSDQPPAATEAGAVEVAPKGQKPAGIIVSTVEVTGTVEAVDVARRTVTLKGPEGKTRTFKVDPSVKRLGEVKKGDQVVARHTEALAVSVSTP